MDAYTQYGNAVTIGAKSDAAADKKDKETLTRTSTDIFADVAAIWIFFNAKNTAAFTLDIKSDIAAYVFFSVHF